MPELVALNVRCILFIACSTFKKYKLIQSALDTGTFTFQVSKKQKQFQNAWNTEKCDM